MERKFERKEDQDKPLGSLGDRREPKEFEPLPDTINKKNKEKEKSK